MRQHITNISDYCMMEDIYDFYLVHSTSLKNIGAILRSGKLLNQPDRKPHHIVIGEGDDSRKLCSHEKTIAMIEDEKCEEAIGVYFRVAKTLDDIPSPKMNQAIIVLDAHILQHYDWHLNYCENNGFYIYEGENTAIFGDESKHCPASTNKQFDWGEVDTKDSEVLVYSSVNLLLNGGKYLVDVITKKMVKNKSGKNVASAKHTKYMKKFVQTMKTNQSKKRLSLSKTKKTHSKSKSRKSLPV